jgi:hypothetical protein
VDDEEYAKMVKKFMANGMPRAAAEAAARKACAKKDSMSEATLYLFEDALADAVALREAASDAGDSREFYRRLATEREVREAVLTAKKRANLKPSDFAIPPDGYPIHDEEHARNALSRVAQNGSDEEKAKVRAAVKKRYPNIDQSQ